ncbi:MAG: ankyrin repeat domain-containing protein [Planctomycetota bacterium]
MKRVIRTALILIPVAILIYDVASGRFSTFRDAYNVDDLNKALLDAAVEYDVEAVNALLTRGAEINSKGDDGLTALDWIAFGADEDAVAFLVSKGADVNAGFPLHMASRGRTSMIRVLLDRGADVKTTDGLGQTPLHYAASDGNDDVADLLIAAGADLNGRDRTGRTPLHVAVMQQREGMVRLLIQKGAEVNCVDDQGRTPLDLAVEKRKSADIADLLREHGAKPGNKDAP